MRVTEGTGPSEGTVDRAASLLRWLEERGGAFFVAEVRSMLDMSAEDLDYALARLEAEERVVVQHNFCADPHFANEDLRAVAVVDTNGADSRSRAAAACERLWQRWTADFLASHRCT